MKRASFAHLHFMTRQLQYLFVILWRIRLLNETTAVIIIYYFTSILLQNTQIHMLPNKKYLKLRHSLPMLNVELPSNILQAIFTIQVTICYMNNNMLRCVTVDLITTCYHMIIKAVRFFKNLLTVPTLTLYFFRLPKHISLFQCLLRATELRTNFCHFLIGKCVV